MTHFSIKLLKQYDEFGRKYLARHNVQITAKRQYRITNKSKTTQRVWTVIRTMSRLGLLTRLNPKSTESPPIGMTDVQYEQWWDRVRR